MRKSKVKIKEETYVWRATYCVKSVSVYCGILRCNSNFRVGRPCQAEVVIITMKFVQIEPRLPRRGVRMILAAISRPILFSHHLPLNCSPL